MKTTLTVTGGLLALSLLATGCEQAEKSAEKAAQTMIDDTQKAAEKAAQTTLDDAQKATQAAIDDARKSLGNAILGSDGDQQQEDSKGKKEG